MVQYTYTVFDLTHSKDITDFCEIVDVTESGTGEIYSGKLRINAEFGAFITNSNGGNTPILDQFNQIRVTITDDQTPPGEFNKVFEVDRLVPIENTAEGNVLEVELLGQEHHLQKIHFAKQFYFAKAFDVIRDIGDFYNFSKASLQPTLQFHTLASPAGGNDSPKFVVNTYEFNIAEKYVYDGLNSVVDMLGASVPAGGAGDFFEMIFENGTTKDHMKLNVFSSGTRPPLPPPAEIVITDVDGVNEDPTEGGIDVATGTLVVAWGAEDFGTLPPDTMRFEGALEAWQLYPDFSASISWPFGSKVQKDGIRYNNAGATTSNVPPAGPWVIFDQEDAIGGPNVEYSPWTVGNIALWINNGADVGAATGPVLGVYTSSNAGMWDANLLINDNTHYRNYADLRAVNPASVGSFLLYGVGGFYRGFRVLVDTTLGPPASPWNVPDAFGNTFADNIAFWDGTRWIVKVGPAAQPISTNGFQVAVLGERKVYERQAGVWVNIATTIGRGNDCFHRWNVCRNDMGTVSVPNTLYGTYGSDSAVRFKFLFTGFATFTSVLLTSPGYYDIGAWINFRFPFPNNAFNSIPFTIGHFYGNDPVKKEPVTLDSNNMHLTHSAKVGFNNDEAEDLGILGGIKFNMRMFWDSASLIITPQGNFRMKMFMYDTNDNCVTQDFTLQFNDHWEQVLLPFSGFKIYRGRTPLRWQNIFQAFILEDIEILNVFQWRNIQMIGIQWDEVYDSQGRFSPESGRVPILSSPLATVDVWIDKFGFYKPLIATTTPISIGRNLEPRFLQNSLVSNYVQLQQLAQSQLEIEQFRHKQYEIRTEGRIDIRFGEFFKLQKQYLVNDSDGAANQIQLVAKKVRYKISKPRDSPGHFERFLTGVKRFT